VVGDTRGTSVRRWWLIVHSWSEVGDIVTGKDVGVGVQGVGMSSLHLGHSRDGQSY
jgi:hypothetical protein